MPFKSKAQQKFMFAKHPKIAKEFAKKTKNIKKLPNYKTKSMEYSDITVRGNIELSDDNEKWYKVLECGIMHSKKYHGEWSTDNYSCEMGPGEIDIKLNFLEAIYNNFIKNANETQPYVDIEHDAGLSLGPITGMKLEEGRLYIKPDWNPKGLQTVQNKEYMYFSITLTNHVNSKSGNESFPVMTTTSLTNNPVLKDQDIIELSEAKAIAKKAGKILTLKQNINGGKPMDELLAKIAELSEAIKAALESDESGAIKAAIGAAIDHLEISNGLATEEEEGNEEMDEMEEGIENPQSVEAPAGVLPAQHKKKPVQMSEHEIKLADENIKMAKRLQSMELKLAENDFDRIYLNKKILPAQKESMFALYCADKKSAIEMLKSMPDLKQIKTFGTDADNELGDVSMGDAEITFNNMVLALSSKENIDTITAIGKIKLSSPKLYEAVMKKGGIK